MKLILDRARNTKLEVSIPAGRCEVDVPEALVSQLIAAGFRPAPPPPAPQVRPPAKKAAKPPADA